MIDLEKKIIYFGYGDVQVGHSIYSLYFRGFKPSVEVGTMTTKEVIKDNNIKWLTNKIYLDFRDIQEILAFEELVKQVRNNGGENFTQFKFKDLTLDFSNYNEKSISIVLMNLSVVRDNLLQVIAC